MKELISFIVLFLIIDSVWVLGGQKIHRGVVEKVQKSPLQVNLIAGLLFYVLALIGYVFIIKKLATDNKSAFLYGLLLGLLMYGTFDFTNKAIFVNYPWSYTIADVSWGTLVFGVVSFLTYEIFHGKTFLLI